jgi:hypothetical protein
MQNTVNQKKVAEGQIQLPHRMFPRINRGACELGRWISFDAFVDARRIPRHSEDVKAPALGKPVREGGPRQFWRDGIRLGNVPLHKT